MTDLPPPPKGRWSPSRIAIAVVSVVAIVWLVMFFGIGLSSYNSLKHDPQPGQREPAPAAGATG